MRRILLVIGLCAVVSTMGAQLHPSNAYIRGNLTGLGSPQHSDAAFYRLQSDLNELIAGAIDVAKREPMKHVVGVPTGDPKYNAVVLLGELRATQALEPLFGQLDYKVQQMGTWLTSRKRGELSA